MPGRNMQEASGAISGVSHRNLHAELHLIAELTTGTVILATFLAFCARNLYSIVAEKLAVRNPIVFVWRDKLPKCCSLQAGLTETKSPGRSPRRVAQPAANSTTAKARSAIARRRAGTECRTFSTRPARVTNTISIGKRMKNVCTAFVGMTIPVVSASASRPRSPLRRAAESIAISRSETTGMPVRSLTSEKLRPGDFRAGDKNVPTKVINRPDELRTLGLLAHR